MAGRVISCEKSNKAASALLIVTFAISIFAPYQYHASLISLLILNLLVFKFNPQRYLVYLIFFAPFSIYILITRLLLYDDMHSLQYFFSLLRWPLAVIPLIMIGHSCYKCMYKTIKKILSLFVFISFLAYLAYLVNVEYGASILSVFHNMDSNLMADLTLKNERFIGVFTHPSNTALFFSFATIFYAYIRNKNIYEYALLICAFILSFSPISKVTYYVYGATILIYFLKTLQVSIGLFPKYRIKHLANFGFLILASMIFLVLVYYKLNLHIYSIDELNLITELTASRFGDEDHRAFYSWSVVLNNVQSIFFGVHSSDLTLHGDSGVFVLMWLGGLIGLILYLVPATIISKIYFASNSVLLFILALLLFIFFPYVMQQQLVVTIPVMIYFINRLANDYHLLNVKTHTTTP